MQHTTQAKSPVGLGKTVLSVSVFLALSAGAQAGGAKVSWEDIVNDDKTAKDVLMYGMGLKGQRFSALKQVNTRTVSWIAGPMSANTAATITPARPSFQGFIPSMIFGDLVVARR